jgi:hypothetical protein
MAQQHTDQLTHEQVRENLPWYLNGRLDAAQSRQVEVHLAACRSCKHDAAELAALLRAGEQRALPERPVDEARLADVFSRIDAYEATRVNHLVEPSFWQRLREQVAGWLPMHPAVAFGAVAALVLVVALMPLRLSLQSDLTNQEHVVLASGDAQDEALRIVLRFDAAPDRDALARLIKSQYAGAYEVQDRTGSGNPQGGKNGTDYVVTLLQKPDLPALSRMVNEWRKAPNVSDVRIESTPAAK